MRLPVCLVLSLVLLAGCSRKSANSTSSGAAPGSGRAPTSAAGVKMVSGTVAETMNAASYTYVRVRTSDGEVWAATQQFQVAQGDRVTVPLEMPMENFHSPSLKRDFPLIYFTSHIYREGEAMPGMMAGHEQAAANPTTGHPAIGNAPPPGAGTDPVVAKMEPPPGGLSIADVWAKQDGLAGKTVTVRGKVMKYNGGILDRNWLHIQDGSGNAKDGTNDLAVTTQGAARVGDIVTVSGKLTRNKDIGSGYSFKVILEDATIVAR